MSENLVLRLVHRRQPVAALLHLVFERADGQPLPVHRAGQFVQFWFDGHTQRRSYSIATAPDTRASMHWEFCIAPHPDGVASMVFKAMQPGDEIEISGPFGRFGISARDQAGRYLLLATGTGAAPYRSLLPGLLDQARATSTPVHLICGARRWAELPWQDEFAALAQNTDGLEFTACLSRERSARSGTLHGRVQGALQALAPRPGDLALLCGNPQMVDACFEHLRSAGLAPAMIRRERFVS